MASAREWIAELAPCTGNFLYVKYGRGRGLHSPSLTYSPRFGHFHIALMAERMGNPGGLPVKNMIDLLRQNPDGEVYMDQSVTIAFSRYKELNYEVQD